MANNVTKVWKLDSPKMCRDFLKKLCFANGKRITFLEQENGTRVSIDEASDEQVMQVANELAFGVREQNGK